MGLLWKQKLTFESFEDFATEYIKPTYIMAYKATLSELEAAGISVDALTKVFSLREYYEETEEDIEPEKAIANAIEPLLTKVQFANLHNPSISLDESVLPPHENLIEMVDKAVDKANAEMPRYAPVYSGTMGVIVTMAMVAVIIAAITLICLNPFAKKDSTAPEDTSAVLIDSFSRLDPDYMVNLSADITQTDSYGREFSGGALPVMVELSGPDHLFTDCLSASDAAGAPLPVYQYGKNQYCCIAEGTGIYCISSQSADGHSAYAYINLVSLPEVSGSDLVPAASSAAVCHGQRTTLELFGYGVIDTCEVIEADRVVSSSDLEPGLLLVTQPKYGTLDIDSQCTELEYTANRLASGLDSLTLYYTDGAGAMQSFTVPVIVSNAAPQIDTDSLELTLVHTPSKPARAAGRLYAADSDGDSITFRLVSTANCSVMLAPNGGYLVSIAEDHFGSTASFSFTVSDGMITTDPVTVTINLENHIIDVVEYTQDFICYGGDYFYTLDLPQYDTDGDKLTWTVISTLKDGLTPNQSRIITGDGSEIKYQISPEINEDTVEVINLICSDGWMQSPTVTLLCRIHENQPPKAGLGNSITVPLDQAEVTCTLSIVDDFELDRCVIDSVYRIRGGSVEQSAEWEELVFTFRPDGTEDECYVIFTVRDTITGATANVRYNIDRE